MNPDLPKSEKDFDPTPKALPLEQYKYNKVNNSIVYNSSSEYFYDGCNVKRQVLY